MNDFLCQWLARFEFKIICCDPGLTVQYGTSVVLLPKSIAGVDFREFL